MGMHRIWTLLAAILGVVSAPLPAAVQGEHYPQRPIRLIVGFSPGGATDLVGRLLADKLSERLAQQVVVDNRPGASGIIGARIVGSSQPDGHTLLISGSSISIVGSLYTETGFDVQRDLEPLALGDRERGRGIHSAAQQEDGLPGLAHGSLHSMIESR